MPMDDDELGRLLDLVGVELELNYAGPRLEPLLQALSTQETPDVLERAAAEGAEATWNTELRRELGARLREVREHTVEEDRELLQTIDAAQAELKHAPGDNHVAVALVWRAAASLIRHARGNYERMSQLEANLTRTPPAKHRRLIVSVGTAATLAADIGDEEAARAIARFAVAVAPGSRVSRRQLGRARAELARELASEERRRDMRAALLELAQLSAGEFTLATAALERVLAEPTPEDPADDELWVSLVVGFAEDQLRDVFSEGFTA